MFGRRPSRWALAHISSVVLGFLFPYQAKRLAWECLRNNLFCVEWEVTQSIYRCCTFMHRLDVSYRPTLQKMLMSESLVVFTVQMSWSLLCQVLCFGRC